MKSSQILKEARQLIEGGSTKHICIAIAEVAGCYMDDYVIREKCVNLTEWIASQLGIFNTLEDWMYSQLGFYISGHEEKFRQTRLAWIDHMIEICESEGD